MAANVAAELFFATLAFAAKIFTCLRLTGRSGFTIQTKAIALRQIVIAHAGQSAIAFTSCQQQDQGYNNNSHG